MEINSAKMAGFFSFHLKTLGLTSELKLKPECVSGLIVGVADWHQKLWTYILVGVGSGLGGMGRFFIGGLIDHWFVDSAGRGGTVFPLGTVCVNVIGCFTIGFLGVLSDPEGRIFLQSNTRNFLMIGFLGGYTTFSSFSLQSLRLAQDGQWLYAALNVILSVVLCLAAVWLGTIIAQAINR